MASFDPSIISQIPDMAPNPVKSTQDAYTLFDEKNRIQANALTLQKQKQQQADEMATRSILQAKGTDISTDEGVNKTAEQIRQKAGPESAMQFKQRMSAQKGMDLDMELKKVQVAQEQQFPMIASMDATIRDLEPMKKLVDSGKMSQADLDAVTARKMMPQIQQLSQEHPELKQYLNQYMQHPEAMRYNYLVSTLNRSKQGREMATQRMNEIKAAQAETRLDQGDRRLDIQNKAMESLVKRRDEQNKNDQDSHITPETADLMADQYLAGDKTVLTGMGRTKGDMAIARNAITRRAKSLGMDGAAIAQKQAAFTADLAEMRKVGNIAGGVEFATAEMTKFMPLVEDASKAVPRGKFVPLTKLIQLGEKNISDPALRRLYVQETGFLNAYDVLAARGGSDTAKREHNRQMLMTADSHQATMAALKAMKQEMEAAGEAGREAKTKVAGEIVQGRLDGKGKSKSQDKAADSAASSSGSLTDDQQSTIDYWLKQK